MSGRIIVEASPTLVLCAEGGFRYRCALHEPVDDQYFQPAGIVSMATVSTLSELNPLESLCTGGKEMDFSPLLEHRAGRSEGSHE